MIGGYIFSLSPKIKCTECPFISEGGSATTRPFLSAVYKEGKVCHRLVMSYDLKFKHPFTCIMSGSNGSGKSSICIQFLKNLDTLCNEPSFDGCTLWCYSEKNAVPSQQLAVVSKNISFRDGIPETFGNAEGEPCLIILHGLLNEVYSKEVCVLFTKDSHHRNISAILITRNLFHQGRYCRDFSPNAKYLVLLKNVRDKNQFTHLARHL